MKRWLAMASVLTLVVFGVAPGASAQDAVKERVETMKGVSGALKALDNSAKAGKVDAGDAARAARALEGVRKFVTLFPKGTGSDQVKTRAKPEIWAEWPRFEAAAMKLAGALEGAQKAAASGDAAALGAAVKQAQATCGTCHKPFRGPRP